MNIYTSEVYWEDSSFIKQDETLLNSLNFSSKSIEVLSNKGFPEWAAPNINFDIFEPGVDHFKLGEDRDDQEILVDLKTFQVHVGVCMIFMNSSVWHLRETLKLYAEMIEIAIDECENFPARQVLPKKLVGVFREKLEVLDAKAVIPESFWLNEIKRLTVKG